MGSTAALLPSHIRHHPSSSSPQLAVNRRLRLAPPQSPFPVARLFGPAIFEASKLKVLYVGDVGDDWKIPGYLPRAYTLTHSDLTARLTLAVSRTINRAQLQGWYHRLQRDEVVAEWRKLRGKMSLHVHCHISGGHFLLNLLAKLRYHIFCRELPVVLMAFVHGDGGLFRRCPELEDALVWVYFHSNSSEFNRVEFWGPLRKASVVGRPEEAAAGGRPGLVAQRLSAPQQRCKADCECCFPPYSLIPWPSPPDGAVSAVELQPSPTAAGGQPQE